mmetsp:Transcript_24578/g.59273  ORF Transcript_24578/g.59273 Transcript_24578/m.59273 type:complete len:211 (+) Transcript_24578:806-1438(+)
MERHQRVAWPQHFRGHIERLLRQPGVIHTNEEVEPRLPVATATLYTAQWVALPFKLTPRLLHNDDRRLDPLHALPSDGANVIHHRHPRDVVVPHALSAEHEPNLEVGAVVHIRDQRLCDAELLGLPNRLEGKLLHRDATLAHLFLSVARQQTVRLSSLGDVEGQDMVRCVVYIHEHRCQSKAAVRQVGAVHSDDPHDFSCSREGREEIFL